MKGNHKLWRKTLALTGSVILLAMTVPLAAPQPAMAVGPALAVSQATTRRPISDFLMNQGTYCVPEPTPCYLFVPPDPNFLGWSAPTGNPNILRFAGIDYAGLATEAYPAGKQPQISGTVTERPLSDGRAEVTVIMQTKGANFWVIDLDLTGDVLDQIANKPTLFGHRPRDIAQGAAAAYGNTTLKVRFINSAVGAPLPDLVQPGTQLEFTGFTASAKGPLTAEFGVPEGTPGSVSVTQTGISNGQGQGQGVADGFPAELINLQVVGSGTASEATVAAATAGVNVLYLPLATK